MWLCLPGCTRLTVDADGGDDLAAAAYAGH